MLGTGDIIYVLSPLDVPDSPTCTVFQGHYENRSTHAFVVLSPIEDESL